jgi:NADH-quinone oxidoreductase subunit F
MAFPEPVLTKRISLDRSTRRTVGYDEYVATGGYRALPIARAMGRHGITKAVTDSGLRGRGGAGAFAGAKWAFMPTAKTRAHYLIINADESEPGTFKDRFLLENDPHQLLEGAAITALAIQADVIFIYIRGEYHRGAKILERAIGEAYTNGIFGGSSGIECVLHRGAGAYVVGEETAMLESLEGKRGWPRNRPPFPAACGAFGMPTTVMNVETFCCVPHVIERGPEWFRSMGTASSPGPKLYGISGHVNRPGVYEQEFGISVRFAIDELAGGVKGNKIKAVIPGGISMGVLTADELEARLDFDDLKRFGCLGVGTAGLIVLNERADVVTALRNIVRFFARESCGQCTPCREGSAWAAKILDRICDGDGNTRDVEMLMELEKAMGTMPGTTICGLADALAWPVRTFVTKFYDEFAARCSSEESERLAAVPLTINRGTRLVAVPMGSNTR